MALVLNTVFMQKCVSTTRVSSCLQSQTLTLIYKLSCLFLMWLIVRKQTSKYGLIGFKRIRQAKAAEIGCQQCLSTSVRKRWGNHLKLR